MKDVLVLGASSSKNSINKVLANFAAHKMEGANILPVDLNDYLMAIYSVDVEEKTGIPELAKKLNKQIDAADGIIISLAEHNGSYTTAFKNILDWLSRVDAKVWKEKPMLLLSTSPGARGGASVMQAAKSYFPFMGGNIIADFSLPSFYENFKAGEIVDDELKLKFFSKIHRFEESINKQMVKIKP